MKLWDLAAQHCVQTVVAHPSEVWSLALNVSQELIFTGSGDGELKIWELHHDILRGGLKEEVSGEVSTLRPI